MLSNVYFLAKFGFDTAENEPAKHFQNFATTKTLILLILGLRARGPLRVEEAADAPGVPLQALALAGGELLPGRLEQPLEDVLDLRRFHVFFSTKMFCFDTVFATKHVCQFCQIVAGLFSTFKKREEEEEKCSRLYRSAGLLFLFLHGAERREDHVVRDPAEGEVRQPTSESTARSAPDTRL